MAEKLVVGPPLTAADLLKREAESRCPAPYLDDLISHTLEIFRRHGLVAAEKEELP